MRAAILPVIRVPDKSGETGDSWKPNTRRASWLYLTESPGFWDILNLQGTIKEYVPPLIEWVNKPFLEHVFLLLA